MNTPRRRWLAHSAALALTAGFWQTGTAAATTSSNKRKLIKPPKLKRGDLVGLVAPSGGTNAAFVETRVKNLERMGFRVKVAKNILAVRGNTAGTVTERVDDLHAMFSDKDVKAVWAVRGGSGASQLLPALDYNLIRRNPKIFVGYSDITALHLAILRYSNLVTFHGPVASAAFTDYAATQLEAVLMNPRSETTLYMAYGNQREAEKSDEFKLRALTPGVAEGPLIGGNLSVLSAMIGTPYAPDWKGAILFLEEIREAPYRIDRMLTQLSQSRSFNDAAGIALGVFRRSVGNNDEEPSLSLNQALQDHFANLRVPALYGCSFGHIADNLTLPLGIRARLDTTAQTITLLEPAVLES